MIIWCMRSNQTEVTNPALEWLKLWPSMVGISWDGANSVFCHCPPADRLVGVEEKLIFDYELAETDRPAALLQSISQTAKFMAKNNGNILTAPAWLFDEMFKTAYHRIWCEMYTDEETELFKADFLFVFGLAQTNETMKDASVAIKAYFS